MDVNVWPQVITASAGLLGTVVGGLITYLVQMRTKEVDRSSERKSLCLAIAAEIDAYLDLVEQRDHVKYAQGLIELHRAGENPGHKSWISGFEKENPPFPVIIANLPNIGRIGPLCSGVVTFYNRAMAVRVTLMSASEGKFDHASKADLARLVESELGLWEGAVTLGRETARQLRNEAR